MENLPRILSILTIFFVNSGKNNEKKIPHRYICDVSYKVVVSVLG